MVNDIVQLLAKDLSSKNMLVKNKPGSIFNIVEQAPNEIGNLAKLISTKVNNELILVKNKLIPFMNDLVKAVQDKANEFTDENELSKYKIVEVNYPIVIDELETLGELGVLRTPLVINIPEAGLPTPDKTVIASYFKHPNVSINAYTQELIEKYGPDGLSNLWDKYLVNISSENVNVSSLGLNVLDKINDYILLLTVCGNLFNEHKESGNSNLLNALTTLKTEVGNYLLIARKQVRDNQNAGRVILHIQDTTAYVDQEVYKKFIESGKSPEVVLGYILKGKYDPIETLFNNLSANAEEYQKMWISKVNLSTYAESAKAYNKYKVLYELVVMDLYKVDEQGNNKIPLDLQEFATENNNVKPLLDKLLNDLNSAQILDINLTCRHIVGDVIFPTTNFTHFANSIVEYGKLNTTLTPQDAATYASIEFILDFLLAQVELGGM